MADGPRAVAVNPLSWVAGGETTLLRLLPRLADKGWRLSATVPAHGRLGDALAAAGIPVGGSRWARPSAAPPAPTPVRWPPPRSCAATTSAC